MRKTRHWNDLLWSRKPPLYLGLFAAAPPAQAWLILIVSMPLPVSRRILNVCCLPQILITQLLARQRCQHSCVILHFYRQQTLAYSPDDINGWRPAWESETLSLSQQNRFTLEVFMCPELVKWICGKLDVRWGHQTVSGPNLPKNSNTWSKSRQPGQTQTEGGHQHW